MLTKLLTSRWTPIVALALACAAFFGLWQNAANNLAVAKVAVKAQTETIGQLRSTVQGRDALIAQQNAGIIAISGVRAEDRVIYLKNYAAADERAKGDDARASQILALPNEHVDELAQCRASRLLLEQELVQ